MYISCDKTITFLIWDPGNYSCDLDFIFSGHDLLATTWHGTDFPLCFFLISLYTIFPTNFSVSKYQEYSVSWWYNAWLATLLLFHLTLLGGSWWSHSLSSLSFEAKKKNKKTPQTCSFLIPQDVFEINIIIPLTCVVS